MSDKSVIGRRPNRHRRAKQPHYSSRMGSRQTRGGVARNRPERVFSCDSRVLFPAERKRVYLITRRSSIRRPESKPSGSGVDVASDQGVMRTRIPNGPLTGWNKRRTAQRTSETGAVRPFVRKHTGKKPEHKPLVLSALSAQPQRQPQNHKESGLREFPLHPAVCLSESADGVHWFSTSRVCSA